jgi:hypothetical protein
MHAPVGASKCMGKLFAEQSILKDYWEQHSLQNTFIMADFESVLLGILNQDKVSAKSY